MKYNDLKQRVLDVLCLDTEEANRLNYIDKIPRILNSALFRIANSININLREYVITITRDKFPVRIVMPNDFMSFALEQNAYANDYNFTLTNFVGCNSLLLYGNENPSCETDTVEYHLFYNAAYPRISPDGKTYTVVNLITNALANTDSASVVTNPIAMLEIPNNIAEAIPHYIVADLLSLDDKVRSNTEMNEFETLLATIDTDRNERQREYHSSRGWY